MERVADILRTDGALSHGRAIRPVDDDLFPAGPVLIVGVAELRIKIPAAEVARQLCEKQRVAAQHLEAALAPGEREQARLDAEWHRCAAHGEVQVAGELQQLGR